ncbi:prepilin-type N-terminal cleavage/methylation domain-containing protein [Delftia sp. PS-11]|uniref:prepilin-type N-terminal cleavage/methylation domain-containing protein n=1 Tax=Delftia sp. PS-11 TaxID=2767222 RepID=UPI002455C49C|nr:prepilin-type N-terminal cleavage/methylation domain-containing protein [Delftia sp. PS-11]KAJ8740812.1 prepilin-type N-terminal cleavage/methylation domain-containing protein [Delftia sp. PS-11]
MAHPVYRRALRGFTLVELMVAIAVMALLALMSWRGLDGMVRAQEATKARSAQQLVLQTVLSQWNADLDALMPLEYAQTVDWDGQVLRLTRKTSAAIDDGALVAAWTRRLVDGRYQWLRWQSPPLRTRAQWRDAWNQAAQWGRNPSDDQRRRETVLLPLDLWRIYYYRENSWSNPQSSNASSGTAGTGSTGSAAAELPYVPDGIRLELTLPPDGAVAGRLTVDWVNPLRSNSRS